MPTEPASQRQMGILVALDVLVRPSDAGPRAVETSGRALERLGWVGRPVVLAGQTVAGRQLPMADADREAWARQILGDDTIEIVTFDPPTPERHGDDGSALERWRTLTGTHQARWLIETGWPTVLARRAGLTVIEVGGRTMTAAERADHEARDLLDATNHLLMTETFRPAAERPTP
ncbi:MAG TPA: hypothetical protein VMT36_09555 [Candidatus Saccharimonadia bacterium]|nr:hypothetical protein [Candidatus Saccharimonadia bacterium]